MQRDIQKIESLIRKCVPIPQKIYSITKRLQNPEDVDEYFPGSMVFIDSTTEQQIQSRPIDNKRRESFCSDKKKRHIIKTQIMANNKGIVIHKPRYKNGRKHDYILSI